MADDGYKIKITVDSAEAERKLKELTKQYKDLQNVTSSKNDNSGDDLEKQKQNLKDTEGIVKRKKDLQDKLNAPDGKTGKSFLSDMKSEALAVGEAIGGITVAVGGAVMAFVGLYKAVSDVAGGIVSADNSAKSLGMNVNNLSAWQRSFSALGYDKNMATQALGSMRDTLINQVYNPNPMTSQAFYRLGVSTRDKAGNLKPAEEILLDVAKHLKGMGQYTQFYWGKQMGLSPDMITALTNPQFMKELKNQKNVKTITEQQLDQSKKLVEQETILSANIEKLTNQAILPLLEFFNNKLYPILNNALGWISGNGKPMMEVKNIAPSSAGEWFNQQFKLVKDFASKISEAQRDVESSGGKNLVSYVNGKPVAYGDYQILPSTASEVMGRKVTAQELMNPEFNKQVRDKYMNQLLDKYHGDYGSALAAYNGDLYNYKHGGSKYVDAILNRLQGVGATESMGVINNSSSHVSNTTMHINVKANNPQQMADAIKQHSYFADKTNSMVGSYA